MKSSSKTRHPPTAEQAAMDGLLKSLFEKSTKPLAIFLGAGASKTFGYPLTRELMLEIFTGLRNGSLLKGVTASSADGSSKSSRGRLWKFLNDLLPGKRMDKGQVPMVTGVLSLLDFSLSTGQALLPGWKIEEIREMRRLLERALLEVIPDDCGWEGKAEEEDAYDEMRKLLKRVVRKTGRKIALITTNYDMISDLLSMEVAGASGEIGDWDFESVAKKVDFGFRWVDPETTSCERVFSRPEDPAIALYKLHGSTNWLRCPLCENIYIHPDGPISLIAGAKMGNWDDECHCSKTKLEAQIVSPSFVREMREPNLIAVWKNALDFLREAGHWLIIGYSFPDEDVGIRALMTRAYSTNKDAPPTVNVVQFDDSARQNYESFFSRDYMNYLTGGLGMLLERTKAR